LMSLLIVILPYVVLQQIRRRGQAPNG
jgi:hypothetical protein